MIIHPTQNFTYPSPLQHKEDSSFAPPVDNPQSQSMEPSKLPLAAKKVQEEIEALIPQITTVIEDENGNKEYGGDALPALITSLKIALGIDETWEGRLRYWSKTTKIINPRKQGYLIPLMGGIQLNPGGLLKSGSFIQVNNEPILGAGATSLFIVPR
ncbi:hypothetical protein Pdw03_1644 [Penicillium digitatum]|nr:hypothetical protein PDIP_87360 [Penicillium digitatum Pd1]EKV04412.1 hypothetical protein PDIP_87360 [Penicillium digitatum Pd1]KAJ5491960.1 hypothetical protein N7453_010057 [Penicillium expansum]QQK46746.1 hypothetical protein Pdw03_1644 [Penicillium digitatum]